jgi:hypothetical protein
MALRDPIIIEECVTPTKSQLFTIQMSSPNAETNRFITKDLEP